MSRSTPRRPRSALPPFVLVPLVLAVVLCLSLAGCGRELAPEDLEGTWRATLQSPGGPLPFGLVFEQLSTELRAAVVNGEERVTTSGVELEGSTVRIRFDWYDSVIEAERVETGRLVGEWRRASAGGTETVMPFAATRGDAPRFSPPAEPSAGAGTVPEVAGDWSVLFEDDDGAEPARGEFAQEGPLVEGTFLTPTGDYRFLAGRYEQGVLRLSTFDGAHAFLFHARARDDGTLEGDFWSRDTYHATWEAEPIEDDEEILPDAWSEVTLTNDEGLFRFEFPDLEGEMVSHDDPRFDGKVVLVNIFGTWCPNCNDEAPLLAAWQRRYGDQGLQIVGLAYEFSGDPERDRRQLRRFAERYDVTYPLLLAGTSDKQDAAATLPDLSAIKSYPTSIFIGRDGKVRKIHSGFAGPGTGEHHAELVAEFETTIRELLAE